MKAISIYAPYATAIATAVKTIELRTWRTSHRGALLICSSTEKDKRIKNKCLFGKAIAIVDLVDCVPFDRETHADEAMLFDDEEFEGYAWILDNIRIIEPIDVKGQQRLFNVNCNPKIIDIDVYEDEDDDEVFGYWISNGYIKERLV